MLKVLILASLTESYLQKSCLTLEYETREKISCRKALEGMDFLFFDGQIAGNLIPLFIADIFT